MKIFKSIWFFVGLGLTLSVVLIIFMMGGFFKQMKDQLTHHAPDDPVAPTSPVKYPGKLTDELKEFVAELEKRDAKIRQREEDLKSIRNSIEQERKEFDKLRSSLDNLHAEFDKKTVEFRKAYIFLEKAEQKNFQNLAETVESLSPSSVVALFLQMNKDRKQVVDGQLETSTDNPENYVNRTILGVLNLMQPRDIAPIFEQMTDPKEGTDESRQLAASLAQQLQRLVIEDKKPESGGTATGG